MTTIHIGERGYLIGGLGLYGLRGKLTVVSCKIEWWQSAFKKKISGAGSASEEKYFGT